MKLPKLNNPQNYTGLYIVDFGESCSVGFTAQEVAELLESERYNQCKVYKIYKASPDGTMELKGVRNETFQLEAGMFFYSDNKDSAKNDFKSLINIAVTCQPPCRAKVNLAEYTNNKYCTAIIYPSEYNDEISSWLLEEDYKTSGSAEAGIEATERFYNDSPQILETHQLFGRDCIESRTGDELLLFLKQAVQR